MDADDLLNRDQMNRERANKVGSPDCPWRMLISYQKGSSDAAAWVNSGLRPITWRSSFGALSATGAAVIET